MQGDLTGLVLDGRYLLQERLGAGGMGEVWRCRDQRIGRDVAVKLLLDLRMSEEAVARFEREARVAGGLSSPLIVTLHDYGHGDLNGRDVPYLVMELLQGRTLAAVRNDERNSRRVLTWGAQVCAALEVAHRAGVVHRDIKPSNVMVTDDGALKVLDFGIARVVEENATRAGLTAEGTVMGTAEYMSPEQAAGKPADARSDLYSFGCLLYFLVTARPPFVTESFLGTVQLQLNGTPDPPSRHRPGLPPELDRLVLALLAKDPAARPAGAQVVREALEGMLPAPKAAGTAASGVGAAAAATVAATVPAVEPTVVDAAAVANQPTEVPGIQQAAMATPHTPTPAPAPVTPSTPAPIPIQHIPMPNPTHPPTEVGAHSPTHVVPEEFGGRGGSASSTQGPDKPGSRISRRKLLLGVGGLAGVVAAGGGAYAAVGGGGKKSGASTPLAKSSSAADVAASSSAAAVTSAPSSSDTSSAPETSAGTPATTASSSGAEAPAGGSQVTIKPAGTPVGSLDVAGQPTIAIQWIANGAALVVADDANGVQIVDVSNPAGPHKASSIPVPLSDGNLQPMLHLDYNAQRNLLVLGGAGGLSLVDVHDPKNPVQQASVPNVNGQKVADVAFNHDGTKLVVAVADNNTGSCVLDVSDPKTNPSQLSALTPADDATLQYALFTHADKYIATTTSGGGSPKFQLWNAADPHNVQPVTSTPWYDTGDDSTTRIGSALYAAETGPWHMLAVGMVSADSNSQDLQFLDFTQPQTPTKVWYLPTTSGALAFHPKLPVIAVGDARTGAATVWDMTDAAQPRQVARLAADSGFVEDLAFSPDGTLLAAAVKRDGSGNDQNAVLYFWKM
ncbi:serine/threonine protein kinase [Catenulispora acidiphila DSM 44928]|uniref:non-specific serine/threonine protein kinase n=1 Tax=Catenulispora acidiphila (strain DSM 44928 / JCM 14897 / NBRC 102108 / NRRL B-24433 / ID139908) TaxID=479433 RepID=C7QB07_CATAD|nr:serine/threonine-protein kinase [Catenulispora acidiphila]ACU74480.1 serine/threonine protein kinase [Catenulispora acidiphila DSM 44928]